MPSGKTYVIPLTSLECCSLFYQRSCPPPRGTPRYCRRCPQRSEALPPPVPTSPLPPPRRRRAPTPRYCRRCPQRSEAFDCLVFVPGVLRRGVLLGVLLLALSMTDGCLFAVFSPSVLCIDACCPRRKTFDRWCAESVWKGPFVFFVLGLSSNLRLFARYCTSRWTRDVLASFRLSVLRAVAGFSKGAWPGSFSTVSPVSADV